MMALVLRLFVHAAVAACDILALLLFVRIVCRWCPVGVLREFDLAGAPLLDRLFRCIRRSWCRFVGRKQIGRFLELTLAMAIVTCMRFGFSAFAGR